MVFSFFFFLWVWKPNWPTHCPGPLLARFGPSIGYALQVHHLSHDVSKQVLLTTLQIVLIWCQLDMIWIVERLFWRSHVRFILENFNVFITIYNTTYANLTKFVLKRDHGVPSETSEKYVAINLKPIWMITFATFRSWIVAWCRER